jgi:photosystem II stability/assembly factor-like uncharacterized protein
MKTFTLSMMLMLFSASAFAQWTWQNPLPQGNSLNSISFSDGNNGYAVGAYGTIVITHDGGANWIPVNSGTHHDLNSVSAVGSEIAYTVGDYGIMLKTTDGGLNWWPISSSTVFSLSSVCFTDEYNGYIAGGIQYEGFIMKTTDGGVTWKRYTDGAFSWINSIDFTDAYHGFAVGDGGTFLKTADGGYNWSVSNIGTNLDLMTVSFPDNNTGYAIGGYGSLEKTTDGGSSWTPFEQNPGFRFYSVSFFDSNNGIASGYYSNTGRSMILSTHDGGTTWDSTLTSKTIITSCMTGASTAHGAGEFGILLKTSDAGTTWQSEWTCVTDRNIRCLQFVDGSTGYGAGGLSTYSSPDSTGVIIKTSDGGMTWTALTVPWATSQIYSIFFTDVSKGMAVGNYSTILKTTDGGITWRRIPFTSQYTNERFTSVFFPNSTTGYIVSNMGSILKSLDGGESWQKISSYSGSQFESVFFTSAETGYVADYNNGILKTTTGGVFWHALDIGSYEEFTKLVFTDAVTGYLIGYHIWKTTDAGDSWSELSAPSSQYIDINFPEPNTGYALNYYSGYIDKTVDGGSTWTRYNPATYNMMMAIWFTDKNTGYVAGYEGNILKTTNGGGYPLSVEDIGSPASGFSLYPNPATDRITIKGQPGAPGETNVRIYSVLGTMMKEVTYHDQGTHEIATGDLAPGIYVILVQTGSRIESKMLVIQ